MAKQIIQNNACDGQHKRFASNGFTLVEMLVVMFIIAIISLLILTNYRSGQKAYALSQASQKVVSDLRRAQNMAMSGKKSVTETIYDYGIHFDASSSYYTIFADKQVNNERYNSSLDAQIEKIDLTNSIKIKTVSPNSSGLDIVFEPPNPKTYINKTATGPATITLQYGDDASLTRTVTVTTAGLVYSN
jgi:prepilin-type N-terminal cleavage/methylation domain-containing protein